MEPHPCCAVTKKRTLCPLAGNRHRNGLWYCHLHDPEGTFRQQHPAKTSTQTPALSFKIRTFKEIMDDKGEFHDGDYRRGYFQGFFQAIEDIKNGHAITACEDFLYKQLVAWRFQTRLDEMVFPPEMGMPAKRKRSR